MWLEPVIRLAGIFCIVVRRLVFLCHVDFARKGYRYRYRGIATCARRVVSVVQLVQSSVAVAGMY